MIRINAVSDLHHDIDGNEIKDWPANVDADVIVVAGDAMEPGSHALRLVRRLYPDSSIPLIYVPGNHDFYSESNPKKFKVDPTVRTAWEAERARMREIAAELGIHLLDDDVVEIAGVRWIGSTLWSSFEARPPYLMFGDAVMEAKKYMRDYARIKTGRGRSKDKLSPGDTINAHKRSVAFIEQVLAQPFDGETVVVTHHAPSFRSLDAWDPARPRDFGHLDWCYASNLERFMHGEAAPALWLHGHIHAKTDQSVGKTRIVANPRGYPGPRGTRENPDFDPAFIVEIEPKPTAGWRM